MKLYDMRISEYIDEVSKKSSVPGGGSVLALVNELSASLLIMVFEFTLHKKGYESIQDKVQNHLKSLKEIQIACHEWIQSDADAFSALMNAYHLKKEEMIEEASYKAACIPMHLYQKSIQLMGMAKEAIQTANKNLISDAQIAYRLAEASLEGSLHHVQVNMPHVTAEHKQELEDFLKGVKNEKL